MNLKDQRDILAIIIHANVVNFISADQCSHLADAFADLLHTHELRGNELAHWANESGQAKGRLDSIQSHINDFNSQRITNPVTILDRIEHAILRKI